MAYFYFLGLALVMGLAYSLISAGKSVRRNRERLRERFGKAPEGKSELESVDTAWRQWRARNQDQKAMDDITWNDLDMDAVFHRINCCQTSVGEETLYLRLRTLEGVPEDWEKWMDAILREPEKRLSCQSFLSQLGKEPYSGLTSFLWGDSQVTPWPMPIPVILRALPVLALIAILWTGFLGLLLLMALCVVNLTVSVWFRHKLTGQISAMRYLSRMLWCAGKVTALEFPGLESLMESIRQEYAPFRHLKSRLSSVNSQAVTESTMGALAEFGQLIFVSDLYSYTRCASVLRRERDKALRLYKAMGMLDTLICAASFRKSLAVFCRPEIWDRMELNMEGVFHPLVKNPVPNTVHITKSSLITGSNASGKSTFLKAAAVNAALGQTLNTCAAERFQMPRALVISSMALRDNLTGGDSYFIAEIKSFKRIMDLAKETPCLCFVDEILRGTNTVERIAASSAVLYSLCQGNCLCLVASHDIELTRILERQYHNYHFSETVTDRGVTFDFIIKEGASNTRNAILLLSTMGFDEKIVLEAHRLVEAFERDQSWPAFGQEKPRPSC